MSLRMKVIKIKFADVTHEGDFFPKTMKYYLNFGSKYQSDRIHHQINILYFSKEWMRKFCRFLNQKIWKIRGPLDNA